MWIMQEYFWKYQSLGRLPIYILNKKSFEKYYLSFNDLNFPINMRTSNNTRRVCFGGFSNDFFINTRTSKSTRT